MAFQHLKGAYKKGEKIFLVSFRAFSDKTGGMASN